MNSNRKTTLENAAENTRAKRDEAIALQKVITDTRAQEVEIGEQVKKLTATADHNDKAQRQEIGDLRLQLEIIPNSIAAKESALTDVFEALREKCATLEKAIGAAADDEFTAFVDRWEPVFKPLYPETARGIAAQSPRLAYIPTSGKRLVSWAYDDQQARGYHPANYREELLLNSDTILKVVEAWRAKGQRFLASDV